MNNEQPHHSSISKECFNIFFSLFFSPSLFTIFINIHVFLILDFSLSVPGFGGLISRPMNSPAYLTNIEYAYIYLALVHKY